MSTPTKPSTIQIPSDSKGCDISLVFWIVGAIVFVIIYVNAALNPDQPVEPPDLVKYLTVAVESTAVRFYNATPDGRVCSIIEVGIRAGNPGPDGPPLNLTSLELYVDKDKQTIANSRLPGIFNLTAGSEELVHGEAFGLVPVPDRYGQTYFDAELVEAVRADLAAGEAIVRVILKGHLGKKTWLDVTCEDVMIDCSGRSAARAQKVDCELKGYRLGWY